VLFILKQEPFQQDSHVSLIHIKEWNTKRVQERTAWVSCLDRQHEQNYTVDDEYEKMEIQQWMENEKYTRDQLLSVVRSQSSRQNKSFKLPKKQQLPIHKNRKTLCYLPSKALSHPYYIPELV
jgi:hypothetical protein